MQNKKSTKSSGNVFIDLGFERDAAAVMMIRLEVTCRIIEKIKINGWAQQEVATQLGVTRQQASCLIKAKVEHLSLDDLWRLASRAKVNLQLLPKET